MTAAPIALTVGEPASIGPEIAVKAREALGGELAFFWIGDPRHLPEGAAWEEIPSPEAAAGVAPPALPVLRHDFAGAAAPGRPDPANARGVIDAVSRAVDLVRSGAAAALCTCPIHKKALMDGAGFAHPGHTEFLAALAGVERAVMMLVSDRLRVVPVTIHIPLAEVPAALTQGLVEDTIRVTHAALAADFGIAAPRLAVCGLNPHAGEGGAMGSEDAAVVAPAVARLRGEGIDVRGPLPADSMFRAAARESYDAAVAMYHDQALIPVKALGFDEGVNVTLGLPFVRTSPDHGTALDIAGRGVAGPGSLVEALRLARQLADTRAAREGRPDTVMP